MLEDYAKKRHFDKTQEPKPTEARPGEGPLTFVVQEHAARNLHYDLRLEHNGALVSWAVPKGPSLNTHDRRLAVRVEDHPLDYAGFEGKIPKGQYGGGEVIVWDRGIYRPLKGGDSREEQEATIQKELEAGKLEIILFGEKLKGQWVLIHTRNNQWLLIKHGDEFASDADILKADRSVVTGRNIQDVALGTVPRVAGPLPDPLLTQRQVESLQIMSPSDAERPFSKPEWTFELKLDGVRLIAILDGPVRLITRNGIESASRLPHVVSQLEALRLSGCALDGEIVQFDELGRPNFGALMENYAAGKARDSIFYAFDVLFFEGKDVRGLPWTERRKILESLGIEGSHLRLLDTFPEEGEILYKHAIELGFEGVVAKRIDSRYESGKRTKNWLKVKGTSTEEFIVCGYIKSGEGMRESTFSALVLGMPKEEGLVHVGNVGGGFDDRTLEAVRKKLDPLVTEQGALLNPPNVKGLVWVKPRLVAEVRFTGWTRDEKLRQPIFMRMRPDLEGTTLMNRSTSEPDEPSGGILNVLRSSEKDIQVTVEGCKLKFSNLDKELWPGVTKRDLAIYYATVANTLLPHLHDRPVSFVRCPEGIFGERFFQKHVDKGRPDFLETVTIYSDSNSRANDYVMCNNLPTLLWMAQMAVLEINPWNSRITPAADGEEGGVDFSESKDSLKDSVLNMSDFVAFDLDPHFGGKATGWNRADWVRLVEAGMALKEILDSAGLPSFVKTSGKSGLHVFVPVVRKYTYDQVRAMAGTIGEHVAAKLPGKVTLEWNTKKRPDGVFVDVNQNVRGKTMAAVYSPRAHELAGVSMPVLWDELEQLDPTKINVCNAAQRLSKLGDLWGHFLDQSKLGRI